MTTLTDKRLISRLVRGIALTCAGLLTFIVLLSVILWDADVYAARDRYEQLKIALFGEWQPNNWCPPGRKSDTCTAVDEFAAALEDASDFTFFRISAIANSDLTVQTGSRYATARDVVDRRVASQWCYVNVPDGPSNRHIELAHKSADEPPVYTSLASLDASALAGTDLSRDALESLARSHCRFE